MNTRPISELTTELRKAMTELLEVNDRTPRQMREFELFGFRHAVTAAREDLLQALSRLSATELLELLDPPACTCRDVIVAGRDVNAGVPNG
jgi:hypothetical protein